MPALLTSCLEGGVPLQHAGGEGLDGGAVADVARLGLGAGLLGERPEPVFPARDEDAVPPACCERARRRLADPRRTHQ